MYNDLPFEQALARLEEIVKILETGNISLEDSLKTYQEGVLLSKHCSDILNKAEGKVLKISNQNSNMVIDDMEVNNVEK